MEEVLKELGLIIRTKNISNAEVYYNRIFIKGREYYLLFMDCLKEM